MLGTDNGKQNAQRLQYNGSRLGQVSAAPFRYTKGYSAEGGVSVPTIAHLPGQTTQAASLRVFTHVTDDPGFLDVAGVTPPSTPAPALVSALTGIDQNKGKVVYNNRYVYPVTGSLLPLIEGTSTAEVDTAAFGDEAYGRAYLRSADGRWKALWTEPPWGLADGHWQLYDISAIRGEVNDVSTQNPAADPVAHPAMERTICRA